MVEALIFVHGWGSSPDVWRAQKEYFCGKYNIALPDISHANDLREAAEILGFSVEGKSNFVLIGWSLGWFAVLELYKSRNIKPAGLVSVNATPKFTDDGYLGFGPTDIHLAKMIKDCRRNPRQTLEDFYKGMLSEDGMQAFQGLKAAESFYSGLINGLLMLKTADYRDFIGGITIPSLLVAGSRDAICPKEASVYMGRRMNNSELKLMDSGHMPFLSRPDEFNAALDSFLERL